MAYTTHEEPYNQIGDGRKVVAVPGTAVQLSATSVKCQKVVVSALSTNTNLVTIGSSTTLATAGSERGKILYAGDSETFYVDNLTKLYVDALTAGNGIVFVYYL